MANTAGGASIPDDDNRPDALAGENYESFRFDASREITGESLLLSFSKHASISSAVGLGSVGGDGSSDRSLGLVPDIFSVSDTRRK